MRFFDAWRAVNFTLAGLLFLACNRVAPETFQIVAFTHSPVLPCQQIKERGCVRCGILYNELMKTLTITEGRGRLGYWLKKATEGQDIGFLFEGKVVALRPVAVHSEDYALQEYGLTESEMAAAAKRIGSEIKTARKRGEVTKFTGGKNDFR
jgi:hypothetical protein